MPASFMKRHRTICAVLTEIKQQAAQQPDDYGITKLADEAITYAQAMSAKLVEYKEKKEKGTVVVRCSNHVPQMDGRCATCGMYVR